MAVDAELGHRFTFRALRGEDLPLLLGWLAEEHVRAWWGEPRPEEYSDSSEPVERFVALLDREPVGMVQSYRWDDFPAEGRVIGAEPGEIGIDYLIGVPALIGQGVGPAMLRAFLTQVAFSSGAAAGVRVDVAEANRLSWRCLEKLGFERIAAGVSVAGEPGPHYVYVLRGASVAG